MYDLNTFQNSVSNEKSLVEPPHFSQGILLQIRKEDVSFLSRFLMKYSGKSKQGMSKVNGLHYRTLLNRNLGEDDCNHKVPLGQFQKINISKIRLQDKLKQLQGELV